MEVKELQPEYENRYMQYILEKEESLLYVSLKYKKLLENLLGDKSHYLIATDNERIRGVLPLFVHENENTGKVLNSLPFYGSNGGIIADSEDVRETLVSSYLEFFKREKCVAATMITAPFMCDYKWYLQKIRPDYVDKRIGQFTLFPDSSSDNEKALWEMLHKKTQGAIKKAVKSGITVCVENTGEAIDFLYKMHVDTMEKIGGLAKRKEFFELFPQIFEKDSEYKLYVAYKQKERVAAVLVFLFNKTVEYFVPVTKEGYRIYQPLSLIIFEAMKQGIQAGYKRWNWGGTWLTQDGVYNFKKRWGTIDSEYYYFTNIAQGNVLEMDKEELLAHYPNYYVYPFDGGINK